MNRRTLGCCLTVPSSRACSGVVASVAATDLSACGAAVTYASNSPTHILAASTEVSIPLTTAHATVSRLASSGRSAMLYVSAAN